MPLFYQSNNSSESSNQYDIIDVTTNRNLLATDVGKLLVTDGNITLTFDEAEAIPGEGSIIYILAGNSSTVSFAIADDEYIEGVATVLQAGQQAELIFVGASPSSNAVLVRRSVDGTAINPSSIGATTRGSGAFTTLSATGDISAPGFLMTSYNLLLLSDSGGLYFGLNYDVSFFRDAANTLAQRNGTSAQEFRLYATGTSSTVYERLSSKYDPTLGVFIIQAEKGASGGVLRPVIFKDTPVPYADLPSAAAVGDGAHAFINDSNLSYNSLNIGSAVAGGGANSTPVVTIGGAWVVG